MTSIDMDKMMAEALKSRAAKSKEKTFLLKTSRELPFNLLEKSHLEDSRRAYYIPDFVSKEDEQSLLDEISKHPFVSLTKRKLQNWGGIPHAQGMFVEDLPQFCSRLGERLKDVGIFEDTPNQVLLNEYRDGKGIDAHKDGPLYKPMAAVLSLKSDAIMRFKPDEGSADPSLSIILARRSLVVFSENLYETYTHRIDDCPSLDEEIPADCVNLATCDFETSVPRQPVRVSLTFRCAHTSKHVKDICTPVEEDERRHRKMVWLRGISEK